MGEGWGGVGEGGREPSRASMEPQGTGHAANRPGANPHRSCSQGLSSVEYHRGLPQVKGRGPFSQSVSREKQSSGEESE